MATNRKTSKRPAVESGDTQSQLVQLLHQVWLAGLGAVGRAQRGAPKLLEELIAEGAQVQADTRSSAEEALRGALRGAQDSLNARMGKVRGEAADAFENLEKVFRSRVHGALTQLGVPSAGEVEALSRRVDALNANIGKLARKAKPVPRARARRNGSHTVATH
jgi:poly(hydroxyalkanoate) granule-associated protein